MDYASRTPEDMRLFKCSYCKRVHPEFCHTDLDVRISNSKAYYCDVCNYQHLDRGAGVGWCQVQQRWVFIQEDSERYCYGCKKDHLRWCHLWGFSGLRKCELCEFWHEKKLLHCPAPEELQTVPKQMEQKVSDLNARKSVLQKQIDRAADELALIEKFGTADFDNGTTLMWLRDDGSYGSYRSALKRHDTWFYSGSYQNGAGVAMDHVINTILTDHPDTVWVCHPNDYKMVGE